MNGILCPTLVGRAHEFGEISDALDSAQRSLRGSAVFLIGEAGVGKSRLAQEAIAEARRLRFSVLYGRAAEADIPLAFRPFAEALLRVLRAVGRRAGCLLVLEDLHWADPETLSIIEYLAENLASEPVVCLCTVRSGEGSGATGLMYNLAAQRRASVIELTCLGRPDIVAMACACLSTPKPSSWPLTPTASRSSSRSYSLPRLLPGL